MDQERFDPNPYGPPSLQSGLPSQDPWGKGEFAPCPHCGCRDATKIRWTFWGGALGPRMMNHVRCKNCRSAYNGTHGCFNTAGIAIYTVVSMVIALAIVAMIFLML